MRDILEGAGMAVLLLVALFVAYLVAVFVLVGADFEAFIQILRSLWESGAPS
jgi:hypothetical protein